MNQKKQDSFRFGKELGHLYADCVRRKEYTSIGNKFSLCKNDNNVSRLRERIEMSSPVTKITEDMKIDTNVDNKVNNVLMHSVLAHAIIGSTKTISGFTQMSELVFKFSFIDKNDGNVSKSKHACQENHSA